MTEGVRWTGVGRYLLTDRNSKEFIRFLVGTPWVTLNLRLKGYTDLRPT